MHDYKIIKEIGKGKKGTVYEILYKNKKYTLKKQTIKDQNMGKIYREIDFSKYSEKYPEQFDALISYDLGGSKEHNHNIKLIYELKDGILGDIMEHMSKRQLYSVI